MDFDRAHVRVRKWRGLSLVAILLLATGVRAPQLAARPMWFDELLEYWTARAELARLATVIQETILDPPLYSFLLHAVLALSHHEFVLKLPSLLFSLLGIAGVFALGLEVAGLPVAVLAALMLSLNRPDIFHAYEVNQYGLLSFCLSWALVCLLRAARTGRWTWWLLWVLLAGLTAYTHYGGLVVLAGSLLAVLAITWRRGGHRLVRRQLAATGALALALTPLLLFWLPGQLRFYRRLAPERFLTPWQSLEVEILTFLRQTRYLLEHQVMGHLADGWPWPSVPSLAIVGGLALFLFLGLERSRRRPDFAMGFLFSWAAYYLVGRTGVYPYGGSRHALILAPYFMVLLAAGLLQLRRLGRPVMLAGVLVSLLVMAAAPPNPAEDIRQVVRAWLARSPTDITYVYYGAVPGFRYQYEQLTGRRQPVPPDWYRVCWSGAAVPYCREAGVIYGSWLRQFTPAEQRAAILAAVGPTPDTFWLVFSHTVPEDIDEIVASFAPEYRVAEQLEAEGAAAYRLQRH